MLKAKPLILLAMSLLLVGCRVNENSSKENSMEPGRIETYYHVIFTNDDNTVLYEVDVLEGATAVYGGLTPEKAQDDEFKYEFKGWDKPLTNVQQNFSTKAEYEAIPLVDWGPAIWF